jgi:Ca-activated chloride channel family protein
MIFANPIYFIILAAVAIAVFLKEKYRSRKDSAAVTFSSSSSFEGLNPSPRVKLAFLPKLLRFATIILVFMAMARPQSGQNTEEVYNQGVDIMMVLDTSSSMLAIDFKPANRIEAAKRVAKEFVKERKYDRIGVVIFSGLPFTQCPLTVDHEAVMNYIDQVEVNMTGGDGTAIGSAIATATNRLKDSAGKSKIIILLTDGRNNAGEIDPLTAAQAAAALGVKIYTIGTGAPGGALYPVEDAWGKRYIKIPEQELDEDTLTKIAETTGGRYFRATDTASLENIIKTINDMEKTEIKSVKYTSYIEHFRYFLWAALVLFGLEIFMSSFWIRKLP